MATEVDVINTLLNEGTDANRPQDKTEHKDSQSVHTPQHPDEKKEADASKNPRPQDKKDSKFEPADSKGKRYSESAKQDVENVISEGEEFKLDDQLNKLFESESISDEDREQMERVFESAVNAASASHLEKVKDNLFEQIDKIEESFHQAASDYEKELNEQVSRYLDYTVDQYLEENRLAIVEGIRTERAESILEGLTELLADNSFEIPEGKEGLLESVQEEHDSLQSRLDESLEKETRLAERVKELEREQIVESFTRDMRDTQADRFRKLAENVEFKDDESFKESLKIIRDQNLNEGNDNKSKSNGDFLTEEIVDDETDNKNGDVSEQMQRYITHATQFSGF